MLFRFLRSGTQAFTVHEAPDPPAARDDRAEQLIFVKDGFSLFAALLPPVWMIANQLWLVLLCYFAVIASLIAGFGLLGFADYWLGYASLALSLIIGFEADSLRRWTLDRRAYRQIASVTGATSEECERRFFSEWLPTVPDVSPSSFTPPGTEGGLDTSTSDAATSVPLTGSVMPPKRTGWRSAAPWRTS